jgi:hypothetical protein
VSTDASDIYIAGLANPDGALVKYDPNGNMIWTKLLSAPDHTHVDNLQLSVDSSGIYLAMATSVSGFLMRYDGKGNQLWSIQIPRTTNSVSVGQEGVYVGGASSGSALLSKYGQSSSLILFGVNPPISFAVVGLLGGVVVISLFWLRRQRKKHVRRPRSAVPYSSPRPSGDDTKWMKRQP